MSFYSWLILIGIPLIGLLSLSTLLALTIELFKLIKSYSELLNNPITKNAPEYDDKQYCYGYSYYSLKYFWHIFKFPYLWFYRSIIK